MIEHLAIVGATGAVGREFCSLIKKRNLKPRRVSLFASAGSIGAPITVGTKEIVVERLTARAFDDVEYAVFSAGADRSREFAPIAVRAGAIVIDNSSAWRMDDTVPLVIPEINPNDLADHAGIIANPNCSTILLDLVLWPLHQANPITRIIVSTYQAVSGAGTQAIAELRSQTAGLLSGNPIDPRVFLHPFAFNLFSHDSPIGPDGLNAEETKMIAETRKIFHEPDLAITATCVRVPVLRAHSESVNLTFRRPITPQEVRELLSTAPGVKIVDDVDGGRFPMPIEAASCDDVLVGRIRQDTSQPDGCGIDLFLCGDQLRKGAALNAIQILELLTSV